MQLVNDVTLFKHLMENPRFMEFLQSPLMAQQVQEHPPLSGHIEAQFQVPTVSQKGKEHSHARESCETLKENLFVHEQDFLGLTTSFVYHAVDLLVSVLSALGQSGTTNAIIYASDPLASTRGVRYSGRMLASNATSTSTTCDDVCETIAGVYEGIIVAITLLIILISGLCCMMGIDTPSRFESSQD
ncbi:hypothetical protein L7F22_004960 [Adiantum nelumboides]|nr:hypothetical protein [Adiantum nelumboides]